jgi:hypothetical protein
LQSAQTASDYRNIVLHIPEKNECEGNILLIKLGIDELTKVRLLESQATSLFQ